jgi:hypothetical protein
VLCLEKLHHPLRRSCSVRAPGLSSSVGVCALSYSPHTHQGPSVLFSQGHSEHTDNQTSWIHCLLIKEELTPMGPCPSNSVRKNLF